MARVARVIPVISYKYLQHPIYRMYNPICYIMLYLFVGIPTPLKIWVRQLGRIIPYIYILYNIRICFKKNTNQWCLLVYHMKSSAIYQPVTCWLSRTSLSCCADVWRLLLDSDCIASPSAISTIQLRNSYSRVPCTCDFAHWGTTEHI